MNLIEISDLQKNDIKALFEIVAEPVNIKGTVAWSFAGNGIRTRTTFIQAFNQLGMEYIELPNFLKTAEDVSDLSGYMDGFYELYVIREPDHLRLREFAEASSRPVINAMSSLAHPCEVLTDAYWINETLGTLESKKILLWGNVQNVFYSWHRLAKVLGFTVYHWAPEDERFNTPNVQFIEKLDSHYDVVITDCWKKDFADRRFSLDLETLEILGNPVLLPTPPFTVGKELAFHPSGYKGFSGYKQKELLLPVQKAVISFLMQQNTHK